MTSSYGDTPPAAGPAVLPGQTTATTSAPRSASDSLAATGGDVAGLVVFATGLILVGSLIVLRARTAWNDRFPRPYDPHTTG